ncbi:bacteriocin immunity protein [Vibrio owensii]|uniref:bacteriocin immunity protein n=1 Tax=Vibrio harveyi group TaxID=717610 RepID=UPI003530B316
MKATIAEYSEADFLKLVADICKVNVSSEKEHNNLVRHFCYITEHPDGSDLIYYPEKPEDGTPENIVRIVKEWRLAQGLACFKD